jgi:YesN/AraC family two-component response regulator
MTDQRMPKMQGTEILTIFKEKKPEVTRILMTGYTDLEVAIDAINEGSIHRYLQKPLNFDELANIIREGLQLYEQCTKAKNIIANEKDDIIGKIKNVFSQIKDVEDNKDKLEEELRAAKEVENKVRDEMEIKIKELEDDRANSDNEISGLNSKVAAMSDELDRAKKEEAEKIQQVKEENMETEKKVKDMEGKLALATKTAQSHKGEMTSVTQERDTALAEKNRMEKKLKQFQANWAKVSQQG